MMATEVSVTVAYAAPDVEILVPVTLSADSTVNDAVAQSGILARLSLDPMLVEFAIFGRRVKGATVIVEGDRVELTRPLVADPKRIRRKRAADHPPPQTNVRNEPRKKPRR